MGLSKCDWLETITHYNRDTMAAQHDRISVSDIAPIIYTSNTLYTV